MTTVIFLIALNIFAFAGLGAIVELNREKLGSMHQEIKKFTRLSEQIGKRPGLVRQEFQRAFDNIDANLGALAARKDRNRKIVAYGPTGPLYNEPPAGSDNHFFGPDLASSLNPDVQ